MPLHAKVAVIIPFYRDKLTYFDNIALQQCFKLLNNYPIIAIKPQHLELPADVKNYNFTDVISFEDHFFENIAGYNRLMLHAGFYEAFLAYEYILIYQLDAFVFKDQLDYWCNRQIDYIGAPWIMPHAYPDIVKSVKTSIQQYYHIRNNTQKDGIPIEEQFRYKTGNGGFSLRRVRKFYEICLNMPDEIAMYNSRNEHQFNEDAFWSVEVNRKHKILKIPGYKISLKFAFELYPARAFDINKQQLPFGCHAWDLYLDFWKPIFKELGYDL
jgi:hypothetical protein